jgi:hypothetical protein
MKKKRFQFNERLHISGMSSESLHAYSREYAVVATCHRVLSEFTELPRRHVTECGSVFRAFANAIKAYLKCYNERIIAELANVKPYTCVTLLAHLKPMMNQMKYIIYIDRGNVLFV